MALTLDPRLKVALNDENSARTMLIELNQQILSCRDPGLLAELLGKYLAVAARKGLRASKPLPSATGPPGWEAIRKRQESSAQRTQEAVARMTNAETAQASSLAKKSSEVATDIIQNIGEVAHKAVESRFENRRCSASSHSHQITEAFDAIQRD